MADSVKEDAAAPAKDLVRTTDKVEPTTGKVGTSPNQELERQLDRLSLDQALRDFEIANARVMDLTQRRNWRHRACRCDPKGL